jgi:hypothetical protein
MTGEFHSIILSSKARQRTDFRSSLSSTAQNMRDPRQLGSQPPAVALERHIPERRIDVAMSSLLQAHPYQELCPHDAFHYALASK